MKPRGAYGAGHIRKRTLKSHEERYDVIVSVDGKKKTLHSGDDRLKAEAVLARWHFRRRQGGHRVPDKSGIITMRKLGELYVAELPRERQAEAASRWRARVDTGEWADWPIAQVGERAVRKWVDRMARTPVKSGKSAGKLPKRQTIQNALNLLRGAFRWAIIEEHAVSNPAEKVSIRGSTVARPESSTVGEAFDYLRADEVQRILDAAIPLKPKTAFVLLAFTGARPKDLYLLTWDRVDVRAATIRYRTHKKGRDYVVHMLPPALEAIRAWWMAAGQPVMGLVFPGVDPDTKRPRAHTKGYDWGWSTTSGKRRVGDADEPYAGYRERMGIKRVVPLYSLRHSAASHLLLGTPIYTGGRRWSQEEVASQLGHGDLSTVRRYVVALGIASQRAVEESREALKSGKKQM
jgi:integrase